MSHANITILETADVRVRQMFLAAGAEVPWHYHTEVVDTMYCLKGQMRIELKNPQEQMILQPGDGCEVAVARPHRVTVMGENPVSYLLIQGVGRYDFQSPVA